MITVKYQLVLDGYHAWSFCRVPLGEYAARFVGRRYLFEEEGVSAAEGVFAMESRGAALPIRAADHDLALRYIHGKANRDWWFKEKGWWERECTGCFLREEWLIYLLPACFLDLFGFPPRTHFVRYIFDNNYTCENFAEDARFRMRGFERIQDGVLYLGASCDRAPVKRSVARNEEAVCA